MLIKELRAISYKEVQACPFCQEPYRRILDGNTQKLKRTELENPNSCTSLKGIEPDSVALIICPIKKIWYWGKINEMMFDGRWTFNPPEDSPIPEILEQAEKLSLLV